MKKSCKDVIWPRLPEAGKRGMVDQAGREVVHNMINRQGAIPVHIQRAWATLEPVAISDEEQLPINTARWIKPFQSIIVHQCPAIPGRTPHELNLAAVTRRWPHLVNYWSLIDWVTPGQTSPSGRCRWKCLPLGVGQGEWRVWAGPLKALKLQWLALKCALCSSFALCAKWPFRALLAATNRYHSRKAPCPLCYALSLCDCAKTKGALLL
jgi:hypothetical protein